METKMVPDSLTGSEPADLICVVCGDKANGMHYRALTCEGCKTFFRRNAKHRDTLKCEMMTETGCEMDMYTRRHCAACRMKKCISVGMQPDRLWDKDRLATRKPIKKKVKAKPDQVKVTSPGNEKSPPVKQLSSSSNSNSSSSTIIPPTLSPHFQLGKLISEAYRSAKNSLPPAQIDLNDSPTTERKPSSAADDLSSPSGTAGNSSIQHRKDSPSRETPATATSLPNPQSAFTPPRQLPPPQSALTSSPTSSSTLPPDSPSTADQRPQIESPTLTPTEAEPQSPALSKMATSPVATVPIADPKPPPTPSCRQCECGCFIHNQPLPPNPPPIPVDVPPAPSASDLTNAPVPDPGVAPRIVTPPDRVVVAVDEPSTSSGDATATEVRSLLGGGAKGQVLIPQIMDIVVLLLRHMINFAKKLPGFQTLTSDDQATLIKGALVEYMILTSCPLYDLETNKFNSEIWPTLSVDPDQVESAGFISVMGSVMSFAVKMQKLELTEDELALLYALAIISPDRKDLEDALKVEELQQPLVNSLQACVQTNHVNKTGHFAKIIMLLTEVRDATEAYMEDLMSIQLSGNKLNPLLEELFNS